MTLTSSPPRLSTPRLLGYAFGEGARVVAVNGLSNFGFLFCTQALGLSAGYAGFVLSFSLLLNAFLVPVMGHVTDHTRSRWGGGCRTSWEGDFWFRCFLGFFGWRRWRGSPITT